MPQLAVDVDRTASPDLMPLQPIGNGRGALSRAVHAVNDARNLADALGANLEWMSEALALPRLEDDVRLLVRDAVEVCRQLTVLLGGAIGSCRAAASTACPTVTNVPLSKVVELAISRASKAADSSGVFLDSEGPRDLSVSVDPEILATALESVLIQAILSAPPEGVVRLNFARSGGHAVLGVSTLGAGLTSAQLTQLHSMSHFRDLGGLPDGHRLSETLSLLSSMLADQGGYIDVELGSEGNLTVFLVVPALDEATEEPAKSGTMFAQCSSIERGGATTLGQKRSETMIVNSDRFGAIEVDTDDVLSFPTGIVGFPKESEFVLIRKADSQIIGWLQSTRTSYLTLPVVSAHVLAPRYPDVAIDEFAERAGLGDSLEELAVLGVLSAPPGQPATVNLMAPIIVNAVTRVGAQVLLEGTRFTTRELFIIPAAPADDADKVLPTSETQPIQSESSATSTTSAAE